MARRLFQAYPGGHPLQPELNRIPSVGINDRVVLAVMHLIFVPDKGSFLGHNVRFSHCSKLYCASCLTGCVGSYPEVVF